MLFDWFTVAAQLINFLILAFLLRQFLFKPVISGLERRKQKIADDLSRVEAIRAEANATRVEYEEKIKEFEETKEHQLREIRKTTEAEKALQLTTIRQEADDLRQKLKRNLTHERTVMQNQIKHYANREVFEIAKKTLNDLASKNLESYVIHEFLGYLDRNDGGEIKKLQQSEAIDTISILTAFEPETSQKTALIQKMNQVFHPENPEVRFGLKPELISGIELQTGHFRFEWNAAGYLQKMDKAPE